ncbi:type IV secretion system protein [Vibrio sp. R78045]|uniref:type IV secretion system protein n=1 Tax=Vibrio sp. R78045 TaxID=3093868 RepID=UPI0036F3C3D8
MFERLFQFIDTAVVSNITNMVGIFATTITPLLGACVGLYIVYVAYEIILDTQKVIYTEVIKTIGSLSICTFVALNTAWFMAHVVPAVLYAGDDIANALLGTDSASGGSSLQEMYEVMIDSIGGIYSQIDVSVTDGASIGHAVLSWILILLTILGFVPFLGVSVAYLLVAKIMVSYLLIIAPLFIMFAFFPSCRSFFQAWTGQCFNYVLLSIMYPLAFTTFLQVLDFTVFAQNINLETTLMTVVIFFALIMLATQIPAFCSTLSGGIGINGLVGQGLGMAGAVAAGGLLGAKGVISGASKAKNYAKDIGKGKISPG